MFQIIKNIARSLKEDKKALLFVLVLTLISAAAIVFCYFCPISDMSFLVKSNDGASGIPVTTEFLQGGAVVSSVIDILPTMHFFDIPLLQRDATFLPSLLSLAEYTDMTTKILGFLLFLIASLLLLFSPKREIANGEPPIFVPLRLLFIVSISAFLVMRLSWISSWLFSVSSPFWEKILHETPSFSLLFLDARVFENAGPVFAPLAFASVLMLGILSLIKWVLLPLFLLLFPLGLGLCLMEWVLLVRKGENPSFGKFFVISRPLFSAFAVFFALTAVFFGFCRLIDLFFA